MKLNRLLTAGLILAGLTLYVACRKFDRQNESIGLSITEDKFFNKNAPTDPLLISIRNYFKGKNGQMGFVEKVVERIGYPRWDKTYTVTGAANQIATESEGDTIAVTYIPFVREAENFVNASLLVKTTPTDTAFKYVCDWQYATYGFDTTAAGWNANDVFHVFALMDNLVFGRNSFRIIDSNLLVSAERNALQAANLSFSATTVTRTLGGTITGRGNGGNMNEVLMPVEVCTPIGVCLWECPENMRGTGSNTTESLPCCMIWANYEVCTTVMVWISGSGEGGTGTGTGGTTTGGSGGGYIPPDPDCPTGTVTPDDVTNPCGPGWTPTGGTGTGGLPPTPEPIDSMLARYSRAIKDTAAYIYDNLSQPNNIEYAFSGIWYNNEIKVFERTTNNDSTNVIPKVMIGNLVLLFIWHSHVSTSIDISERSTFSPSDIDMLRHVRCLKQNFASFADCRNKRYALVITDVTKASAFFNSHDYDQIDGLWTTTNNSGNIQDIDERRVKNVIGSMQSNGIAFYVSNDSPSFQSWTLLNQ